MRVALLALLLLPALGWGLKAPQRLVYQSRGTQRLYLDLYRSQSGQARPLVVVFHGGGWVSGNPGEMSSICLALFKEGYSVAAVQYRLAPKNPWPAQIEDARAAVAFLRRNSERLRLKPEKVAALGFSAGGHLGSWLGVAGKDSERVQAVVSISGIHDLSAPLTKEGETYRIVQKLLGAKDPKGRPAASPINYVNAKSAPHFFLQGDADPLVPESQSKAMQAKLKAAGVATEMEIVPKMGHGLNPSHANQKMALARAIAWLKRQGVR